MQTGKLHVSYSFLICVWWNLTNIYNRNSKIVKTLLLHHTWVLITPAFYVPACTHPADGMYHCRNHYGALIFCAALENYCIVPSFDQITSTAVLSWLWLLRTGRGHTLWLGIWKMFWNCSDLHFKNLWQKSMRLIPFIFYMIKRLKWTKWANICQ